MTEFTILVKTDGDYWKLDETKKIVEEFGQPYFCVSECCDNRIYMGCSVPLEFVKEELGKNVKCKYIKALDYSKVFKTKKYSN